MAAAEQGPLEKAGARLGCSELLPLVYGELRQLAAVRMAQEKPGQTLEPTALVHEAFLRLAQDKRGWTDSNHFYCAAATAMRRILIERARHKGRLKHGGLLERVEFSETDLPSASKSEELLALDEALARFEEQQPQAAQLVELRYFAGLNHEHAAQILGISTRTADRLWAYARAWLLNDLKREMT